MENSIKRMHYQINETAFEKNAEQSFQTTINLPDYCGDIGSVLHCFAFANITSGTIRDQEIKIEGNILIRMLYLSEGEIYSYEQSLPFSKSMESQNESVGAVLQLKTYLQYLNCRAVSARAADVGGAFLINAIVSGCRENSVIDSVDNESMQVQTDSLVACTAGGMTYADVTPAQVVDIGSANEPVKSIISNTARALVSETKQVEGKVLIKGELIIKTLYKSELNHTKTIENTIPLSHILDLNGCREDSTLDIQLTLMALEVTVKPNALGSMSLLDISSVIRVSACAYNCIDFPVLKDCYSTRYQTQCTFKKVKVDRIMKKMTKSYLHTFAAENLGQIRQVIDVWAQHINCKAVAEADALVFSGSIQMFVLFLNDNNEYQIKEFTSDYSWKEPLSVYGTVKCNPHPIVEDMDYLLRENRLEVRMNVKVDAVVLESMEETIVDDITVSDAPLSENHSLFIYYAKSGEKIWDIARKYAATVETLSRFNHLEGESLEEDKALMIWR